MNILFIHQNFPGQFRHIAALLAASKQHRVVALAEHGNLRHGDMLHPDLTVLRYKFEQHSQPPTHQYLRDYENHIRRGQQVARAALELKRRGFVPDVVIAHPGWGEALFLEEVFPHAKHIHHCEFYYQSQGADVGFDPEFPSDLDAACRIRIKNSTQLQGLVYCHAGVSPTQWQKSRYPVEFQSKIQVIHEGIDTRAVQPDRLATFSTGERTFRHGDEVVTYVARSLEPYRGFHTFMRSLPTLQRLRPAAHILIVGGEDVSYGRRLPEGKTYRQHYCQEMGEQVDWSRVHIVGKLPYAQYLKVLQVSAAHVYLTYPFVLSWSMLEAMAAGCVVIGSATAPVQEIIQNKENGLLVDFFNPEEIAAQVSEVLANPKDYLELRLAARATVVRDYDLHTRCLPQWTRLVQNAALSTNSGLQTQ
jgi:glycosyltransferase involved in cell wall biosynthesis